MFGSTIDKRHGSSYDIMLKIYNYNYTITKINDNLFYYALPLSLGLMIHNPICDPIYHQKYMYIKLSDQNIKKINCLYDKYSKIDF
jgi:hypothetical protein